jgi:hypothetical protein
MGASAPGRAARRGLAGGALIWASLVAGDFGGGASGGIREGLEWRGLEEVLGFGNWRCPLHCRSRRGGTRRRTSAVLWRGSDSTECGWCCWGPDLFCFIHELLLFLEQKALNYTRPFQGIQYKPSDRSFTSSTPTAKKHPHYAKLN